MKYALLKGSASAGIALSAGQHEFTMQKSVIDKLLIGLRSATDIITETVLKGVWVRLRWVAPGVDIELCDCSLWFLAKLTDAAGGAARDWSEVDLKYCNIVHKVGVDLSGDGVIQGQIIVPSAVASASIFMTVLELEDGSRPPAYRYRQLTTSGNVAYESAVRVFSWDETGDSIDMQVENDKRKAFPYILGRILFAEEAQMEVDTEFCRLFSAPAATRLNLFAGAALTLGSVEVP